MALPELPRYLQQKIFWHIERDKAAAVIQSGFRSWARRLSRVVRALLSELERLGRVRTPSIDASVYVHVSQTETEIEVVSTDGSHEAASSEEAGWWGLAEATAWWRPHRTTPSAYMLLMGLVSAQGNEVLCTVWRSCPAVGMVVAAHHRYRRRRLRSGAVALARLSDDAPSVESIALGSAPDP